MKRARLPLALQAMVMATVGACHSSPSEPPPDLSGPYLLATTRTTTNCGQGTATTQVNIQQSGDQISFLLGVDTGSVSGTVMGRTVALRWEEAVDAGIICQGTLSGTGSLAGRVISGTVSGPTTCCGPQATISFTLTPR